MSLRESGLLLFGGGELIGPFDRPNNGSDAAAAVVAGERERRGIDLFLVSISFPRERAGGSVN